MQQHGCWGQQTLALSRVALKFNIPRKDLIKAALSLGRPWWSNLTPPPHLELHFLSYKWGWHCWAAQFNKEMYLTRSTRHLTHGKCQASSRCYFLLTANICVAFMLHRAFSFTISHLWIWVPYTDGVLNVLWVLCSLPWACRVLVTHLHATVFLFKQNSKSIPKSDWAAFQALWFWVFFFFSYFDFISGNG